MAEKYLITQNMAASILKFDEYNDELDDLYIIDGHKNAFEHTKYQEIKTSIERNYQIDSNSFEESLNNYYKLSNKKYKENKNAQDLKKLPEESKGSLLFNSEINLNSQKFSNQNKHKSKTNKQSTKFNSTDNELKDQNVQ